MPRPSKSFTVAEAAENLIGAITALVQNLQAAVVGAPAGRVAAAPAHGAPRVKGQRGAGKGNPKLKSALKKSWANYTPKQRAERVRKMLAGRGLRPKGR